MSAERYELERLVRGWLLNRPRASALRVQVGDEWRTVAIPPNAVWASVAQTIVAMQPDTIEALDEKGAVLRVTDPRELTGDAGDDESQSPRLTTPAPAPAEALVVPPDAESQRFALFARLIADAYRHSTDVAFERLAQLSERSDARAASLERAVETMYRTERARLERMNRELEEREEELEEREDKEGNSAIDKIVQSVAKNFVDDDDDAGGAGDEPPQPNGKAH